MKRSDFVERGEVKVDFLKNYRLISRWACKTHDLQIADLELLFYLDPLIYFTVKDFKEGTLFYCWDKKRFYRLLKQGWIEKTIDRLDNGNKGHNKYKVSTKGKRLISRIYRILIDKEELPESPKRNKLMKRESYTDKVYSQAIKAFNRKNN